MYQVDAMPNWYQIDGNFNAIGWIYKTRDLIQMSTHVTKSYLPNDYIFQRNNVENLALIMSKNSKPHTSVAK